MRQTSACLPRISFSGFHGLFGNLSEITLGAGKTVLLSDIVYLCPLLMEFQLMPPTTSQIDQQFYTRCQTVKSQWENGDLPFKEALVQLNRYRDEAQQEEHLANIGAVELVMGLLQHYRGNLNISIQHYQQARAYLMHSGDEERIAHVDLNQGENYRFKGDINNASRLYKSAYYTAKRLGNLPIQTLAALNEGLMMVNVGRYYAARALLSDALTLAEQWEEDNGLRHGILCEIYYGLAVMNTDDGDLERAREFALESARIAHLTEEPLNLGFAYRTMAIVTAAWGRALDNHLESEADVYYRMAIQFFRDINAEAEVARTVYAQALTLAGRGQRTTAARKLQHVMVIFTRLEMLADAARAAEVTNQLLSYR